MDFQDRFFGRGVPKLDGPTVANPHLANPPSFQLLFSTPFDLDADALTLALRDYHPELANATVELQTLPVAPTSAKLPTTIIGLVGWGRHVIKLVGSNSRLDAVRVRNCVQPSHYHYKLKEAAYDHVAHVVLHYAGYEQDPLEQHVALAATAAALTRFGAIVAMNETAHTSAPAIVFLPHEEDEGDSLAAMRSLPLPLIYAGFVLLEIEGETIIWMRTFGCHVFKLPDLAFRGVVQITPSAVFDLFSHMLAYLQTKDKTFAPGDTICIGEGLFFRLRMPTPDDWFLESDGSLLVVEQIDEAEAKK